MKNLPKIKVAVCMMLLFLLTFFSVFAENIQNEIKALPNSINVTVNGQALSSDNLLYQDRTYVQLNEVSKLFNAELAWNAETKTAMLKTENTAGTDVSVDSILNGETTVIEVEDYRFPRISYEKMGVSKDNIFGVMFKGNSVEFNYVLDDKELLLDQHIDYGLSQELLVFTKDGKVSNFVLVADNYPTILPVQERIQEDDFAYRDQLIYMPANPEKGFNFPYYIYIPDDSMRFPLEVYSGIVETEKRYLIFEMNNTGKVLKSMSDLDMDVQGILNKYGAFAMLSGQLGYPTVMPIVPRTGVEVEMDGFGKTAMYEHALDRSTMYLKELTTTDSHASENVKAFENAGVDYEDLYDLDEQMKAIMEDAIKHLNDNGFGLEEKVIVNGYSASGAFADRFSTLHPEIVEMALCGSTLSDPYLPASEYNGQELNYPLGTADYKALTGEEFTMEKYNSVKRFIYRGKADQNTPIGYGDAFTVEGNRILKEVMGGTIHSVVAVAKEVYASEGAEILTAWQKGAGHTINNDTRKVLAEFIDKNADTDEKVYEQSINTVFEMEAFGQ